MPQGAPGMRASLPDCAILQYMLTYGGLLLFSKDANHKYRFLNHDCFVAEITTASKKTLTTSCRAAIMAIWRETGFIAHVILFSLEGKSGILQKYLAME